MSNVTSDPINLFLSGFNDGFKSDSLFNNYYNEMITPDRYKINGFDPYKYSGLN